MSMTKIPKFPRKMEELLGAEGKDEFIDFLNDSFHQQGDNVLQVVSDRFDRRVTDEVSKLRIEMTNEISGLRIEMRGEISGLKVQVAEFRAELQSDITSQTKWIVTIILAAAALISFIHPVMMKFLKIN